MNRKSTFALLFQVLFLSAPVWAGDEVSPPGEKDVSGRAETKKVQLKNGEWKELTVVNSIHESFVGLHEKDLILAQDLYSNTKGTRVGFRSPEAVKKLQALGLLDGKGEIPEAVKNVVRCSIEETTQGWLITSPDGDPGAMFLKTNRAAVGPFLGSTMELVGLMDEGKLRATPILIHLLQLNEGLAIHTILNLDDMNIRGDQIVTAYMFAKKDLTIFRELVDARDPSLVAYVNSETRYFSMFMDRPEEAVRFGAAEKHGLNPRDPEVYKWILKDPPAKSHAVGVKQASAAPVVPEPSAARQTLYQRFRDYFRQRPLDVVGVAEWEGMVQSYLSLPGENASDRKKIEELFRNTSANAAFDSISRTFETERGDSNKVLLITLIGESKLPQPAEGPAVAKAALPSMMDMRATDFLVDVASSEAESLDVVRTALFYLLERSVPSGLVQESHLESMARTANGPRWKEPFYRNEIARFARRSGTFLRDSPALHGILVRDGRMDDSAERKEAIDASDDPARSRHRSGERREPPKRPL